ncbi:rare lipoprotein A [Xenorhabdus mauleonii]|uniref:Endolytic peptidoglycan transglycosylase RlpA n=1 Tax=Xenorhabdus mauleonii TaxID=351675 RepID=A0A1I3UVB7_9GAMM|nr:endolytic peptidoglycan transglycosylase RlpA [Xenorhabdus mauleonii]PHM37971.1 rare lipoprotein A [Xenorhabdus mauleonii]SFJ86659.1 rare lipoprotein A [Xenorhabdus mauleonii]
MRQQWLIISIVAVLISGCTLTSNEQSVSKPQVPTQDVLGAEPQYEPYHPSANQDYQRDGHTYRIVQDPANFTQTGYASWFGEAANGKLTAIGERASPNALTAAHPTLPIPSYVRVTNLSNGRMMIVRINDRGPYNTGKIIELSRAAAERLNLMPQSRVKLDGIQVAPDDSLSGLGTVGSTIVKQSYALPDRPSIDFQSPLTNNAAEQNLSVKPEGQTDTPSTEAQSPETGFSGTSASETPASATMLSASGASAVPTASLTSSSSLSMNTPSTPDTADSISAGKYMVQVGAVSIEQKAREWQQSLSQRLNVQGRITQFGNVYRVQLGPFNSRQQAVELQKKLTDQMHQSSFIVAP